MAKSLSPIPPKQNGKKSPSPGVAGGNPFGPMSLAEIEPEMVVYGPSDNIVTIDYKTDTKTMIQKMKDSSLLDYPRIVFITHGFWGNTKSKWLHELKAKFLADESIEQIFVIVGWGKGAEMAAYKYPQVVANTEPVGRWLGNHILEFKRKLGMKMKIWGIGEGIGAHVMGIAGRISHAFWRITGWHCLFANYH